MKTIILSTTLLMVLTLNSIAQNPLQTKADSSYFSLAFGVNFIDNSNGNSLPFDFDKLDFRTPFFLTAEQKFKNNWSLSLSLSTNQLELDRKIEPYYGADMFANLFIDQILFNSERIDLYVGLGAGLHTMQAIL